jgi:hypothetical protein
MSERRQFLRAISVLPLAALASETSADAQLLTQIKIPQAPPRALPGDFSAETAGDPDPKMNLFGGKRPRSWHEVRDFVSASLTAHPSSNQVKDWMDTFSLTFDQQARAIVIDAYTNLLMSPDDPNQFRYEPGLFESALRTAAGQLDRCLAYRNEMGEYEIAGINAGLSYLTFLKISPLQLSLIRETNRADIGIMEKENSQLNIENYNALGNFKHFPVDDVYVTGLRQDAQGNLSEAELNIIKENNRTTLLEEQFKIQVDAQLAQFLRFTTPGTSSNFSERYIRLARLLEEDLGDALCGLISAAKGVQSLFSGLNNTFVNFPLSASTKVDVQIPKLDTDEAITAWIRNFSARPAGFPPAKENRVEILDALVLWCRGLMRELDRRGQYESEFTVSIPLGHTTGQLGTNQLVTDLNKMLNDNKGLLKFNLQQDALPASMKDVPIRIIALGISVQQSADDEVPIDHVASYPSAAGAINDGEKNAARLETGYRTARIGAVVQPPPQTIETHSYKRPQVFLPEVRLFGGMSGDTDPKLSYDPACRNIKPFGDWTISLDQLPLVFAVTDDLMTWKWVNNVIIHLRVRGRFA